MNALATRVKVLMATHNENSKQLADAIGITPLTIANILHSKHNARYDTICLIANHYHVPADFLVNGKITLSTDTWYEPIK